MSQKILLKRSSVIDASGNPKLPEASVLEYGEIAVNYASGVETLSIKNSNDEIVTLETDVDVETLEYEPKEDLLKRSNGRKYKIGDEVRIVDSDSSNITGYKFYKLYNLKDNGATAVWDVLGTGGTNEWREKVNITLTSNQSLSDSSIKGATVKITDTTNNTVILNTTWSGSTISTYVTPSSDYKVEVGNIIGYKTPTYQSYTAEIGYTRDLTFTYETEIVTVNVSCNDGSSVSGQTVTINGSSSTLTSNTSVTAKVPFGTTYSVSVSSKDMYTTPATQKFTASTTSRTVNMEYKYHPLGVYIQATDGVLYTSSEWSTANKTANAIAVLTNKVKVLLALTQISDTMQISYSCYDPLEEYTTGTTNLTTAKLDYNGRANTANIMKMQPSTKYAAGACNAFTFPDGKTKGYLPSLGEWLEIYQNKSAVDAALAKCGGTAIYTKTSEYHWSSTFHSVDNENYRFCWFFGWFGGYYNNFNCLDIQHSVRAVAAYPV